MINELPTLKNSKIESIDIENFYSQFYMNKWDFTHYRDGDKFCKEYLKQFSLDNFFFHSYFVCMGPDARLPVHLDYGPRSHTFVYGLKNKEHLEWMNFEVKPDTESTVKSSSARDTIIYHHFQKSDIVRPINSRTLDNKFIANIKTPHTVINNSKSEFAYLITMRLTEDFDILKLSEVWK